VTAAVATHGLGKRYRSSWALRDCDLVLPAGHALDSRVIIEQAKGVLVAKHQITPDEAFEHIRRHARNHNVALTRVADAIVQLRLDP